MQISPHVVYQLGSSRKSTLDLVQKFLLQLQNYSTLYSKVESTLKSGKQRILRQCINEKVLKLTRTTGDQLVSYLRSANSANRSYIIEYLGKPHLRNHPRHLGIALLAIAPPPPHSNGHSGALHLGKKCPKPSGQGSRPPQNEGNSSKKSCPKPSGQGFRPPPKRAMPKCLRPHFRWGFPYWPGPVLLG